MVNLTIPWEVRGLCGDSGVDFFAQADLPENPTEVEIEIAQFKTQEALTICSLCPVRRECITSVLTTKERFGVWGGADQDTIRKALSVDESGDAVPRAKDMVCPYCKSSHLEVPIRRRNQIQIHCNDCSLSWWASKPNSTEQPKTRDIDNFGKDVG